MGYDPKIPCGVALDFGGAYDGYCDGPIQP